MTSAFLHALWVCCSLISQAQTSAPRWGRSAGVHFEWQKWTKSHLGRSPLRTSLGVRGWACVKSKFGPRPLWWPLSLPPHQATLGSWPYNQVVSISGPTLEKRRSRRREPGHQPLGTAAHQDKALAVEGSTSRGVGGNHRTESHLCDMNQSRAEQRRTHAPPSTGGVDSTRRGKAPPLVVFGSFLAAERNPQRGASPPGWQA